jgi:hypothetical protein
MHCLYHPKSLQRETQVCARASLFDGWDNWIVQVMFGCWFRSTAIENNFMPIRRRTPCWHGTHNVTSPLLAAIVQCKIALTVLSGGCLVDNSTLRNKSDSEKAVGDAQCSICMHVRSPNNILSIEYRNSSKPEGHIWVSGQDGKQPQNLIAPSLSRLQFPIGT